VTKFEGRSILATWANRVETATSRAVFGGASFFADPYSAYANIRATGSPVFESISGAWLVTRYADVDALLRDARVSKNMQRSPPTPFETSVLFQDAPAHARTRGILNQAFSANALPALEDRVRQIADGLIDRVKPAGGADFMSAFAQPLPVLVMAALLGIPPEDTRELGRLSGEFIVDDTASPRDSQLRQQAAIGSMAKYFERRIESRRGHSGRDILSALMQANAEGRMSHDEMIGNCILLMVAGHETTVNLLGNGMHLLLRHPDQLELLKRQPDLWPSAIEEILRYESPVQLGTFRITTEAITIAGETLEAGSSVTAVIGSANRDPAQFREPDRFDITRKPNRHLAFGMGSHFCLGASLARTQALIGFSRLFERLPDLRSRVTRPLPLTTPMLDCRGSLSCRVSALLSRAREHAVSSLSHRPVGTKWRRNAITRGVTELPVSW
jgi:cytochrome P450